MFDVFSISLYCNIDESCFITIVTYQSLYVCIYITASITKPFSSVLVVETELKGSTIFHITKVHECGSKSNVVYMLHVKQLSEGSRPDPSPPTSLQVKGLEKALGQLSPSIPLLHKLKLCLNPIYSALHCFLALLDFTS